MAKQREQLSTKKRIKNNYFKYIRHQRVLKGKSCSKRHQDFAVLTATKLNFSALKVGSAMLITLLFFGTFGEIITF